MTSKKRKGRKPEDETVYYIEPANRKTLSLLALIVDRKLIKQDVHTDKGIRQVLVQVNGEQLEQMRTAPDSTVGFALFRQKNHGAIIFDSLVRITELPPAVG